MEYIGSGVGWVLQQGVSGLAYLGGNFCRFMTTECEGTFLIFALIGSLIYIGGGEKVGMKMIRISLGTFLAMGFIGVIM